MRRASLIADHFENCRTAFGLFRFRLRFVIPRERVDKPTDDFFISGYSYDPRRRD